jgi:hypothetical protein
MANKKIDLTIRATNGTPWDTDDFGTNQRVDHVRRKAIDHFVDLNVMQSGDYALALVRDNTTDTLIDSETLEDTGVMDGAVLALMVRGPQVDG